MSREIRRRLKRKGLRPKAIMLYGHLHGHCFFAPTCWPSQHLLAQRMGVSQALVNGLCQELREAGVLSWKHEHKRGSKHPCNVYTLRYWTRPRIAGTLRVLRRLERANSGCPDRKGQHSRALTPSRARKRLEWRCARDDSLLVAGSSENQKRWSYDQKLWSRGARVNRCPDCGFRLQEGRVCENCHRFAEENGHLSEEISGLLRTTRKLSAENAALAAQLTKMHGESPKAEEIRRVGEAWLRIHPKARFPVGGRRWKVIERALKDHTADELLEALEGLRLKPFIRNAQRVAKGVPGACRYDDVEHALGDEKRIEAMRGIAHRARMLPAERWWAAYQATMPVSEEYFRRAVESLSRNGDGR